MMFRRLGLINKKQRGFTLIELLIAIAITGLIMGGITTAIFQTFTLNARNSSHMTAVRQVQNAGHWISLDAQMALEVELYPDPADGFLTLTWTDWGNDIENEVTYTITLDDELKRSHSEDGSVISEIIVARYIDLSNTSCQITGNGTLMVTLTATVGDFPEQVSETRLYEVIHRPNV